MFYSLFSVLMLSSIHIASALPSTGGFVKRDDTRNNGIHLAVEPHCGSKYGEAMDINEGLRTLTTYKTVVALGVRSNTVFCIIIMLTY